MVRRSATYWVSFIILLLLALLHVFHLLSPDSQFWGVIYLGFLSRWYTFAFIMISLVGLIISAFNAEPDSGRSALLTFSKELFESPRALYWQFATVTLSVAAFLIFSMPTHFLGDGYSLLYIIGNPHLSLVKWSEQGIFHTVRFLQNISGGQSRHAALVAFRIVSVASGATAIWFFFRIADSLSDRPFKKLWILLNLVFSGSILMFFGYVESYPPLWATASGFTYFAILYLKSGRALMKCLLFILLGLFFHLQTVTLFAGRRFPVSE